MSQASKSVPDPKTSIAPMLSVRGGAKAVEFYKAAFGASELFLLENDGSVVAQLSVGSSDFWVADESPEHLNFSPESLGGATTRMVMVAADPDAALTGQWPPEGKWLDRSRTNRTAGGSGES